MTLNTYKDTGTDKVVRFNWDMCKRYTGNDPEKILDFLHNVYVRKTENYLYLHNWAAKIVTESKEKRSFIKNIQSLVDSDIRYSPSELFVYLDICSMRNYFTYINTGCKVNYLPQWKVVNKYNVEELLMNRLLTLDDYNIYLLYEGD